MAFSTLESILKIRNDFFNSFQMGDSSENSEYLNTGSYMSACVLLNLLNKLGKMILQMPGLVFMRKSLIKCTFSVI